MSARQTMMPAYLGLCLFLGGASAAGFLANALLQIGAAAILALSVFLTNPVGLSRPASSILFIAALLVCVPAVQLVPLPPAIWQALPGREAITEGFAMLGLQSGWMPMSLAPADTVASLLWLLPALAVLVGMLRMGAFQPTAIAWTIVVVCGLSIVLGALQIAGGERSLWYFYSVTNRGNAVGIFANANHQASLMVLSLPFLAALLQRARRNSDQKRSAGLVMLGVAGLAVFIVGIAINGSLAGIGLGIPALATSALLLRKPGKLPRWLPLAIGVLAFASVAAIMFGPFGNNLITAEARNSSESRLAIYANTIDATIDYAPVGSGVGTFVEIYRTLETHGGVDRVFVNTAHNDYLQIALEAGLPGVLLVVVFLAWWIRRVIYLWRDEDTDLYGRAASIATGVILLHSVVDYPLRTAAISAVFAACIALMARPRAIEGRRPQGERQRGRHLSAG